MEFSYQKFFPQVSNKRSGYSLIEVVIALGIFGAGLLVASSLQTSSTQHAASLAAKESYTEYESTYRALTQNEWGPFFYSELNDCQLLGTAHTGSPLTGSLPGHLAGIPATAGELSLSPATPPTSIPGLTGGVALLDQYRASCTSSIERRLLNGAPYPDSSVPGCGQLNLSTATRGKYISSDYPVYALSIFRLIEVGTNRELSCQEFLGIRDTNPASVVVMHNYNMLFVSGGNRTIQIHRGLDLITNPAANTAASPFTVDLKVNDQDNDISVNRGDNVTLKWNSINVDRCELTGMATANTSRSNQTGLSFGPINNPTTFRLTCWLGADELSDEIRVTLNPPASVISANLQVEGQGDNLLWSSNDPINITWTSSNANTCTVMPYGHAGTNSPPGGVDEPVTQTVTIVLTCTRGAQSTSDTITVTKVGSVCAMPVSGTYAMGYTVAQNSSVIDSESTTGVLNVGPAFSNSKGLALDSSPIDLSWNSDKLCCQVLKKDTPSSTETVLSSDPTGNIGVSGLQNGAQITLQCTEHAGTPVHSYTITVLPPAGAPDALCGAANGAVQPVGTRPIDLESAGTMCGVDSEAVSTPLLVGNNFQWSCKHTNFDFSVVPSVACSATLAPPDYPAECGDAFAQMFATNSTAADVTARGACKPGSQVLGSIIKSTNGRYWNWTCEPSLGNGTDAVCSAGILQPPVTGGSTETGLQAKPSHIIVHNGGIYALGSTFYESGPLVSQGFVVVKLDSTGNLDTSFANTGIRRVGLGGPTRTSAKIKFLSDGKILLSGQSQLNTGGQQIHLVRLNPNGFTDMSYGTNGVLTETPSGAAYYSVLNIEEYPSGTYNIGYGYVTLSDVSIFGAGARSRSRVYVLPQGPGGLARIGSAFDGSAGAYYMDQTGAIAHASGRRGQFVSDDIKLLTVGTGSYDDFRTYTHSSGSNAERAGVAALGKGGDVIYAVGSVRRPNVAIFDNRVEIVPHIWKFNPDSVGADRDFADERTLPAGVDHYTKHSGCMYMGSFYEIDIQTDGKLLVTGRSGICRVNPDGSLDTSFAGNGRLNIAVPSESFSGYRGPPRTALQPDGKIVVVVGRMKFLRFNSNGSPDLTFGN